MRRGPEAASHRHAQETQRAAPVSIREAGVALGVAFSP